MNIKELLTYPLFKNKLGDIEIGSSLSDFENTYVSDNYIDEGYLKISTNDNPRSDWNTELKEVRDHFESIPNFTNYEFFNCIDFYFENNKLHSITVSDYGGKEYFNGVSYYKGIYLDSLFLGVTVKEVRNMFVKHYRDDDNIWIEEPYENEILENTFSFEFDVCSSNDVVDSHKLESICIGIANNPMSAQFKKDHN